MCVCFHIFSFPIIFSAFLSPFCSLFSFILYYVCVCWMRYLYNIISEIFFQSLVIFLIQLLLIIIRCHISSTQPHLPPRHTSFYNSAPVLVLSLCGSARSQLTTKWSFTSWSFAIKLFVCLLCQCILQSSMVALTNFHSI